MAEAPPVAEPIRLHLSESPYGASPLALAAAQEALARTSVYPDPTRAAVRDRVAAHWRLPAGAVAVANGSDELVLLCSIVLGAPDRPGVTSGGTFPGYRICLETTRRGAVVLPLAGGALDVERFAAGLAGAGVGFVCNPHNPSGSALSRAEMDALVEAAGVTGTPLVFDEAYMEFAPPDTPQVRDYLDGDAPLVALRTFSKAYGLAGLRIGYALGSPHLVAAVVAAQETMPFSVNRVAQAAALAALDDQEHLASVRARNEVRRAWFAGQCALRRREARPSVTNFVALPVPAPAELEAGLASRHGILVRDAGRFGFAGHLRVSLGSEADLTRLLDALDWA